LWTRSIQNRKYRISDYQPSWVERFEEIKVLLEAIFDNHASIEHIGSTAVPGMKAKPQIDVLVEVQEVRDLSAPKAALIKAGYSFADNYIAPETITFFKLNNEGEKLENIHICQRDSLKASQLKVMRDFLCAFPEKAEEYSQLKTWIVQQYPDNYLAYRMSKQPFLDQLEQDAYNWMADIGQS
jgi:GrpB-like predicted nucleotidyltransferase (UPF0157 family)